MILFLLDLEFAAVFNAGEATPEQTPPWKVSIYIIDSKFFIWGG